MEVTFKQRAMSFGMALGLAILPIGANAAISNNGSANSNEPGMEELKEDQKIKKYEERCQKFIDGLKEDKEFDPEFDKYLVFQYRIANLKTMPEMLREIFLSVYSADEISEILEVCGNSIGIYNNDILLDTTTIDINSLFNPSVFYEDEKEKAIVNDLFQEIIGVREEVEKRMVRGPHYMMLFEKFFDAINNAETDEFRVSLIEGIGWPFLNYLLNVMRVHGDWAKYVDEDGNIIKGKLPDWQNPNVKLTPLEMVVLDYNDWLDTCLLEYDFIEKVIEKYSVPGIVLPVSKDNKYRKTIAIYSDSLNTIFVIPRNKQYQLIKDRKFKQVKRA